MTKKFLAITAVLALTTPFLATAKKQPQVAIESNNLLVPPIENIVIAGSFNSSYNLGMCTRDGLPQPTTVTENTVADFPVPVHCKETNCGIGVYSLRKDSDEERCSYCGSLKPVNL